jgi:hypothetical protein
VKPFQVIACDQRSDEWRLARAGRLTGSCAEAMLKTIQKGESKERSNLRRRLVAERFTGIPAEDGGYKGKDVQRGIDREGDAVAAYEAQSASIVQFCGFLAHTSLMAGCSLDGYVGDFDVIVEVKCPAPATHLDYLMCGGKAPAEYLPQITHNLWVSGAKRCDFISFDDRFRDPSKQLYIASVLREDVDLEAYDAKARAFLAEVDRDFAVVETAMSPAEVLEAALEEARA